MRVCAKMDGSMFVSCVWLRLEHKSLPGGIVLIRSSQPEILINKSLEIYFRFINLKGLVESPCRRLSTASESDFIIAIRVSISQLGRKSAHKMGLGKLVHRRHSSRYSPFGRVS